MNAVTAVKAADEGIAVVAVNAVTAMKAVDEGIAVVAVNAVWLSRHKLTI